MVASFDSQYWQRDESDEIAAPQFGQLRVSACISVAQRALLQLNVPASGSEAKNAGRPQSFWCTLVFERNGLPVNEIETRSKIV